MVVAVCALVGAVAAYGVSGLALASGSRTSGSALRSRAWWTGTALQGAGFGLSLLARTVLPLLLVQAAIAGALAVTVLLEHLRGVRALDRRAATGVALVVAGVAAVAVAVVPGPTRAVATLAVGTLWAALALAALLVRLVRGPWALGAVAGCAFGVGAVAGRLLVGTGGALTDVLRFWAWSGGRWAVAVLIPAGIVVGQWALTRALAAGPSAAALGGDYLLATILPSAYGALMLGERLRAGLWPVALLGLLAALWGTRRLLDG